MEKNISEALKEKYYSVPEVSNLKEILYQSANIYGKRPAFQLKDSNDKLYNVSYSEFKKDVINLGTALLDLGLAGKSIAVIGKNSYSWIVSYLAASIIGIVVPIDKELLCADVINFLNASEASCFIGDNKSIEPIWEEKEKIDNKETIFVDIDNKSSIFKHFDEILKRGEELISTGDTSFDELQIDENTLKILLFTSGTTGNAKGVCLSHKNIVSNIISVAKIVKVDPSVKVLSVLPIHHTYECTLRKPSYTI